MQTNLLHNPDLTASVIFGLGWVYLLLSVMNAFWVRRSYAADGDFQLKLGGLLGKGISVPFAAFWATYAVMLLVVAATHLTGFHNAQSFTLKMPEILKAPINAGSNPVAFFVGSTTIYIAMIVFRKKWTTDTAGWVLLNLSMLFMTLSVTRSEERRVGKECVP